MPLDLEALELDCIPIIGVQGNCIRFPGGAEICFNFPRIPADNGEAIRGLLAQANTALAPLQPILNIIDAVIALFNCLSAIPDAILKLDPTELIECIPELGKKIAALLNLIPQLSLPALLVDLLDLIIGQLQALRNDLFRIASYQSEILALELEPARPGALDIAIECAKSDIEAEILFLNEQNEPLNRLLGLIGALLQPFGIDLSESLGEITSFTSVQESLIPIDKLIDVLTVVRKSIPLP